MPTANNLTWLRYAVPAVLTIVAGMACFILAANRVRDDSRVLIRQHLLCLPVPPTPTPTLLALPRELRDQIFRYLLVPANNADIALSRWNSQRQTRHEAEHSYRALRLTSSLVREEVETMFSAENVFVLDVFDAERRAFRPHWITGSRQKGMRYDTIKVWNPKLRRMAQTSYAEFFLFGGRDWELAVQVIVRFDAQFKGYKTEWVMEDDVRLDPVGRRRWFEQTLAAIMAERVSGKGLTFDELEELVGLFE
ncbi:hypothetical protein LTR85_010517 [Meristemomyces frigidus]|nr:hypothetical protein LTR85_010517 [Meristemomyces frigidus]